jgi:hypothetical protein
MALGFLQRKILNYLKEHEERKPQAVLIVVGGWLQGGRCVTHVISQNYTPDASNILREPRLVELIKKNMEELPPIYLNDPLVTKITNLLPEIKKRVNVGLHDPVKPEDVKWLHETFGKLVLEVAPDGGAANSESKNDRVSTLPGASAPPAAAK